MMKTGTKVLRCRSKKEVGYVLGYNKYGFNIVWWPKRKWSEGEVEYTAAEDEVLIPLFENEELNKRDW